MAEKHPYSISPSSLQISLPFRMILSGSSGAGKSHFIMELIDKEYYMFSEPVSAIYYFYVTMNSTIKKISKMPKVILKNGFSLDQVSGHDGETHIWVIIDDHLTRPIYHDLANLFANNSRAQNISVTLLTQNMYTKAGNAAKFNREVLVNRTHSVVFPCRQDDAMVQAMARNSSIPYSRIMGAYHLSSNSKITGEEFGVDDNADEDIESDDEHTKRQRHSHLLIQFTPGTKPELELRSKIFFMEETTELFWPL